MKNKKTYYKDLDVIRFLSCIGVLFYHLGYLPGGFLSVCCFFVLSGYLSYTSLSKQNKFSFKEYYEKRFFHIYVPLLLVVLLTIATVSFIPNIHWFNLKPESSSVLFGYNNFWQLSVNADYFARHVNSPFMHFWYIAILLQFDLIFPFLFRFLQFCKKKIHKSIPLVILFLFILTSGSYFVFLSFQDNIMIPYYHTLARVYALFLGVFLGYTKKEYGDMILPFSNSIYHRIIFYGYCCIFVILQFFVKSNSPYFAIVMILFTILSYRMIEYGTLDSSYYPSILNKTIRSVSGVSYEIYLFQYPILFFFQYVEWNVLLELACMLVLIVGFSYFVHFSLNFKDKKNNSLRIALCSLLGIFALLGSYYYVTAKDYTSEMNDLKKQLDDNQKLLAEKQKEYKERMQRENEEWQSTLNDLENNEKELDSYILNSPIVGVGDSVMLGAVSSLYERFPNGYFDAQVSRTDYEANRILQGIKSQGILSDNIIIHLGTNGQCGRSCQNDILNTCEGRNVYFVTVSNDAEVHVNHTFFELAEEYDNVHIIDWNSVSVGHSEYFAADGIHLTGEGRRVYTDTIYQGIYQLYYQKYLDRKQELLLEHEKEEKSKISFYGNDVLLNMTDLLQDTFPNSNYHFEADFDYSLMMKTLEKERENLNYHVVLSIDSPVGLSLDEYQKIITLLGDREIYFIFIHHKPYSFSQENVHTINFYYDIQKHDDYMMIDHIHLSKKGEEQFLIKLKDKIQTKKEES